MNEQTVGFIGAGNMATALAGGLLAKGHKARRIWMSDPSAERVSEAKQLLGVETTQNNADVTRLADVLILAVKPQVMEAVCRDLRSQLDGKQPLIISIAAGITLANLKDWLGDLPMVRCMPNTPALVQTGATGLCADSNVSPQQKELAAQILGSVGLALWFEQENALDAVTAVSGSGPAYFFLLMESMISAGQALGLESQSARQLVLQTALGASQLAITSEAAPDALRQQVTSPGGTTAAAINTFEAGSFRELVNQALTAARDRSEELSG